jgi:hypothetical protein
MGALKWGEMKKREARARGAKRRLRRAGEVVSG